MPPLVSHIQQFRSLSNSNTFASFSIVNIAVMSLAGLDFFQTDYPLELALEGKALRLFSDPSEFNGVTQAELMEHCGISGSVANSDLGVALAAEQLLAN